uniref:Uncharacterized protein n=1 Tax=Picea glauca TaxID=3330 RepID=A0A124GNT1_PICGL|nr:hypothetical protein ABT39_MTgene3003 [Picea glauca]QHR91900.1 hypothetical protein Q903MT_gene5936 [Picea sitchensis]
MNRYSLIRPRALIASGFGSNCHWLCISGYWMNGNSLPTLAIHAQGLSLVYRSLPRTFNWFVISFVFVTSSVCLPFTFAFEPVPIDRLVLVVGEESSRRKNVVDGKTELRSFRVGRSRPTTA